MFIETITIHVTEGSSEKIVERFSQEGPLEKAEGFIDMSILAKDQRRGDEEVIILIRWESKEAWKNWEKSEPHLEMHRKSRGKPKPEYVINRQHHVYEVKATKTGR